VRIKLLLYTGIRNSELANLTIPDVELKDLRIRIRQGKGKKDRYVPIPPSFREELAQYIASQKEKKAGFLFETSRMDRFSTRWVRGIVHRYARKAGMEKRIYPHLFRHQLLTFLTKKGIIDAKIQLISGHKSRQSLADVEEEYQEAMKDFPVQ
jgi:integrase/recombinase XerD